MNTEHCMGYRLISLTWSHVEADVNKMKVIQQELQVIVFVSINCSMLANVSSKG